jgi:hypothetical protein
MSRSVAAHASARNHIFGFSSAVVHVKPAMKYLRATGTISGGSLLRCQVHRLGANLPRAEKLDQLRVRETNVGSWRVGHFHSNLFVHVEDLHPLPVNGVGLHQRRDHVLLRIPGGDDYPRAAVLVNGCTNEFLTPSRGGSALRCVGGIDFDLSFASSKCLQRLYGRTGSQGYLFTPRAWCFVLLCTSIMFNTLNRAESPTER